MSDKPIVVFMDCFDTVSDLKGKNRTYEKIKAAVLKAGMFSCFDVVTRKDGIIFTRLCHDDPEIEVVKMKYPWTGIKLKEAK